MYCVPGCAVYNVMEIGVMSGEVACCSVVCALWWVCRCLV